MSAEQNIALHDVAPRCPGSYQNQHGEFGLVINAQCVGCRRRTGGYVTGNWYLTEVPEFAELGDVCPLRVGRAQ